MSQGPRIPRAHALERTAAFLKALRKKFDRVELAGSVRRGLAEVGDVDIVIVGDPKALPSGFSYLGGGAHKVDANIDGVQVNIMFTTEDSFGACLMHLTGSKEFNVRCRAHAKRRGLKLNEYGVWDADGDRIAGACEDDMFRALGLEPVSPQDRG
jgi:DNA polymerase (family 10)